jgi:hypothetical protein
LGPHFSKSLKKPREREWDRGQRLRREKEKARRESSKGQLPNTPIEVV